MGVSDTQALGQPVPELRTELRTPELLERDAERAAFTEACTAAARGAGRLVIVEGAAGMGKTELLGDAARLCQDAGLVVVRARGAELEREYPFAVVRQLFGQVLASAGPERKRLLAGAAQCAPLFGATAGRAPAPESPAMFRLLDGLYRVTANLAQDRGIALIVDDVEWSDPQSLMFLSYLSRRVDTAAAVLILGTRPRDPAAADGDLGQLLSDPAAVVLRPRPLSCPAVAHLVRAALGERADPPFCLVCYQVTKGNPLLVRELLRALAADQVIPTTAALAAVRSAGPWAVARYVKTRAGLLRAGERELAEAVAILGDRADLRLAAELAGIEAAAAARLAEQLVHQDIFARAAPPSFMYPLVREAIYQSIPAADRQRAHDRAAALLAAAGPPAADAAPAAAPQVPSGDPPTGGGSSRRVGAVVTVLALAVLMSNLDIFVVNLAFPFMSNQWPDASMGALSWVLNAYTIVFAAVMVPAGRWADRFGRRKLLVTGLAVFCAGSALSALAPSMQVLITARAIQGAGAGVMVPASLSLLLVSVPAPARQRAIGTWAGMGAVGAALGPLIGGSLVQLNWRWVFWINLPVGLAAIALAFRILPKSKSGREQGWPDLLGAGLLAAAVGLVAYGLVEAPSWGWASRNFIAVQVGALACAAVLALRSRRHRSPVIELGLLRSMSFSGAFITSVLYYAGFGAFVLNSVEFLTSVWNYSPVHAGLAIVPGPLVVLPVARLLAPRMATWLGGLGRVAALGCVVNAGAQYLWFTRIQVHPAYLTHLLPSQLLGGVGVGLAVPSLLAAGSASLPRARFGTGSGVLNMARQVGTVLGVAGLIAILARNAPGGPLAPYRLGIMLIVAFLVAASLAAITTLNTRPASAAAAPARPAAAVLVPVPLRRRAARVTIPATGLVVVVALTMGLLTGGVLKFGRVAAGQSHAHGAVPGLAVAGLAAYPGQGQRGVFQTISRVAVSGDTVVAVGAQVSDGVTREQFFVSADGGVSWRVAAVRAAGGGRAPLGYPATRVAGGPGGWLAVGPQAIWTSRDGLSWTLAATHGIAPQLPGDSVGTITNTASGFVAAGGNATQAVVWISSNGVSWQRLTAAQLELAWARSCRASPMPPRSGMPR